MTLIVSGPHHGKARVSEARRVRSPSRDGSEIDRVAAYFTSDVHLRLDRPDRGRRLARWVETLGADDLLFIVGDLCDFWFASRQRRSDSWKCPGLRALAAFTARGGALTILPGNHDAWLGPFYSENLGARFESGPLVVDLHGLRVHLAHGHLQGARPFWKGAMEGRAFLSAFGLVPLSLASALESLLDQTNLRAQAAYDRRHLAAYRRYADELAADVDLAVFGHIHGRPTDDPSTRPRLIVLGDWLRGSSYLKIDDSGARLVVNPAEPLVQEP